MFHASRNAPSLTDENVLRPLFDCPAAFAANLAQVQCAQLAALGAWQQSISAMNQELWDMWTSRWAGGVPIDA